MPFRAPNLEPVLAGIMPLGKRFGGMMVFAFGFLSIAIYDSVTSGFGIWTLITSLAYGFIGLGSKYYLKNRNGWKGYASYAFISTILYDAVTGLTIGPIFFHQSFIVSLVGQVPFTIIHLLGNISFAIVISPIIEKWILKERSEKVVSRVVLVS